MKVVRIILFLSVISNFSFGQKITFDPVDWTPDQPVTVRCDLSGTAFSGSTSNLYLWSWYKNGANESVNSANNGLWTASAAASQLTNQGGNIWTITIVPSAYFGVAKEILNASGFYFLIKTVNGSQQSTDFGPIKPMMPDGIALSTTWVANKKIKIIVDVSGTPLSGNAGPLYYWGWYNAGAGDVNAPANGGWTSPSPASAMTQIATNVWSIELLPTVYFGTTTANLTPERVFGLVKNASGSAQTPDLGLAKLHKRYVTYQVNASNVTLTPALPADNVPVTIRFDAGLDLLGYTGDVFMHSGVVLEGLASNAWSNTQGTWGSSTSLGKMTRTAANQYEITIPSVRSYYQMTTGQTAFKIMAVFRSADGAIVEKDGANDFALPIQLSPYLEIREPAGTFITKPMNQPFRITGFTPSNSNFTVSVNGSVVQTQNGVQRSTVLYTPTAAGNYTITVSAVNGGTTFTKTTTVSVCGVSSVAMPVALPAGLQYGINYNPADATRATLVLHAPTESKQSVHVIGDFNNWTVDCNFLMNYDATKKTFWKELTGLTAGREYVFQYLIDGETRIGDPYAEKVSDPWADSEITAATYPNLVQYPAAARPQNGETPTIATVLQTNQSAYVWKTTAFNRPAHNKLNIYQLHFRDFTTEGTYLAAIEKLDYLKRMGINAVETLPVSEFEGNNSWGYNPNYFFAVDKAYGTKTDFKVFVDECHKRGIAVLGDIVLNHAFGTNAMARMYWDNLNNRPAANNPWFNAQSNFSNPGAQWGNDFNHTSVHTQGFVDRVNKFWAEEFKIDGIRFDFTKGFSNTPYPNASCPDIWGSCYDAGRVAILKRMTDQVRTVNNGATGAPFIVIFEHLATDVEDKELADYGILLWGGHGVTKRYEEIAMGWPPTSSVPDKTDVGVAYYKSKNFNFANAVSYMESHDEQRMGYQQLQFGNGSVKTDPAVQSQFLQVAAAVNLLFPGPRMVWQFGELGYDVDINFNGRTGRKPIRWDYYDVPERRKIYETYARLFYLRNHLSGTFQRDFDNPSNNKTDLVSQFKRYHFYNAAGDTAVTVVANTANSIINGDPKFNASVATWYEYMTGQTHAATNNITLQPGEFRVYFNKAPAQTAPIFGLTRPISGTVGQNATNITLRFDKPVWRAAGMSALGESLTAANVATAVELRDAANNIVPISASASFDGQTLIIDPNATLPVGNYTITLLANAVQNYGGLRAPSATYNFSVQCVPTLNLASTTDDLNAGTHTLSASSGIEATNKITATANVKYEAGSFVVLRPGFVAMPTTTGTFRAQIGGCN